MEQKEIQEIIGCDVLFALREFCIFALEQYVKIVNQENVMCKVPGFRVYGG